MSYRCQQCHAVVAPKVPIKRLVVETRPRTYVHFSVPDKTDGTASVVPEPVESYGEEIVHELSLCESCHTQMSAV